VFKATVYHILRALLTGFPEEELNADVRAANADALWVGPPFVELLDLSFDYTSTSRF
jgi:hypothetical protein